MREKPRERKREKLSEVNTVKQREREKGARERMRDRGGSV